MHKLTVALVVLCGCVAAPALAQSAGNVAVVINDASPVSQRIGEYYAGKRGVPASNVIRIRTSTGEAIDRQAYESTIESPIAAAIARQALQDRVVYLVLTKGVPLRIAGSSGANATGASVDSELTLLYRRTTGRQVPTIGRVENPYFLAGGDVAAMRPFTHRDYDIYLVARLDGFTEADVIALIDRGMTPSTEGRIVLDQRDPLLNRTSEARLASAAAWLEAQGHGTRVLLETTTAPVRTGDPVLGYFAWGSIDPQHRARQVGLRFAPGAIAASFVASDARTFETPPEGWAPTTHPGQSHRGSAHSLVGDLIREGVTGAAGHVTDPYSDSTVRPDILFPAYLAGANLVEAFYLALPHLSWQTVVVGDPLCAPFRREVLSDGDLEVPIDEELQLPSLFAARRVAALAASLPGVSEAAVRLGALAEGLTARGDAAGARRALEKASGLAPRVVPWQLQLATLDETAGQLDAAIDRYRKVIDAAPNQVGALNNLAYLLATHRKAAKEALPFAQRAVTLAPKEPLVADTLGWIEHLLGNHEVAARLMTLAVRGAPNQAEVRLHAAIVHEAAGARAAAEAELEETLRLDPSLVNRPEVGELKARLGEGARD
jgi:uncharacterized protein (TIGR03790 family)